VYLVGNSEATWGMPVRAFAGWADAFAAKLNASGQLLWNTFLGEWNTDRGSAIAVDGSGNVYVGGYSWAAWQGTNPPVRAYTSLADAFAAKLNASGVLQWNTFLGGTGYDDGHAIAVDGSGNVYLGGDSDASWQGTNPPVRAYTSGDDAFAVKLGWVEKNVDNRAPQPGQLITYTLTVYNETPTDWTDAVISDTLPTELTFAGPVTLDPPQPGATLADDAGDLPTLASGLTITAGERITVTLPVTVSLGTENQIIINTASVTSTQVPTPNHGSRLIFPTLQIRVTHSEERADQPDVAIDSNGNVHIAYSDEYGTSEREIWYTMLDNNGNTLIDDTRLTDDDDNDSTRPAIVVDSADKVHIAWRDQRWDGGGAQEVTYTKLDPYLDDRDGTAAISPTITLVDDARLTDIGDWSIYGIRMAVDSNDDIHIVWDDYDAEVIYYMKIDDNGNELVAETVIRSASQWRALPHLAVDSNDNVHVTWNDNENTSYYETYYMMLDGSNGNTLIDATLITTDDGYESKWQSIVVDFEDKVHVIWQDGRAKAGEGQPEIYHTKLDPSLDDQSGDAANEGVITLIGDTALTPDDGVKSNHPAIAIGCGRYIHITWYEDWEQSGPGYLHYMVIDNNGNTVTADTAVSTRKTATTSTSFWTIAYLDVDENDKAHITWCDDRTGDYEVWYTSYEGPPCPPPPPPPPPPVPVGGVIVPVNKLELLALRLRPSTLLRTSSGQAPWVGLVVLVSLAALTIALVRRRAA
jgi:uncharacterized repeat protein (TIGR01451 family)